MAHALGYNAKLYYNTDGAGSESEWTEIPNVKDLTIALSKDEVDASTRAGAGWKATVGTLKSADLSFEMVWNPDDANFAALRDAWLNHDVIGMAALDQEGGEGPVADYEITKFERQEPIAGILTVSVEAKVTYSDTAPQWTEEGVDTGGGG